MTFAALIHFILTNWWSFVGACVLIGICGSAAEDVVKAIRNRTP